ncbi:hypothetical protein UFOVP355_58 [uncultured Caudovirales phage]|uniref:Uncharacterized protein n=1 Tax=uncultured Caudovirales phage TaxID=2100421 RepID=A0A6J5NE50_9CAUD|nr:hypothetical protein UFOVP355_58 [uncultured Caudovirales phage]CAB4156962.1 hypothetical protein UFOVP677_58 [uncultured Caudovirales phage]
MPLISNDNGAIDRSRLAAWATKEEAVTVVAATDAATTQSAATLAGAAHTVYTMTPTASRTLTTPTGAELGAAFTDEGVGSSFRFSVTNAAAATHPIVVTAGASGVTLVGVAATFSVAAASAASFVAVFTAANTVSIYRA